MVGNQVDRIKDRLHSEDVNDVVKGTSIVRELMSHRRRRSSLLFCLGRTMGFLYVSIHLPQWEGRGIDKQYSNSYTIHLFCSMSMATYNDLIAPGLELEGRRPLKKDDHGTLYCLLIIPPLANTVPGESLNMSCELSDIVLCFFDWIRQASGLEIGIFAFVFVLATLIFVSALSLLP